MKSVFMFRWIIVAGLCLVSTHAVTAEPELMAALSVMGYGYKVTVNGADVGVVGGKNEIVIEYSKIDPKGTDQLEVTFSNGQVTFPVPRHAGHDISLGVERKTLRLIGLSAEQFSKL